MPAQVRSVSADAGTSENVNVESKSPISDDGELANVLDVVLYSITLTIVHFTLDVLVQNQYRQEMDLGLVSWRAIKAFPMLLILVYMLHPRASQSWVQLICCVGATLAGCYLVYISYEAPYFAVMKRAPPVATLWIWFTIDSKLSVAVISASSVLGFLLLGGYNNTSWS